MVRIPSLRRQRFEIVQCIISPDTGKLAENNEQAVYCGVWKKKIGKIGINAFSEIFLVQ